MLLRFDGTRRATHRELVSTVLLATRDWLRLEDVWNATRAREEWFRLAAWRGHSDFRLLDRVLEEEAAEFGGDALLGLDRRRRRSKGACQGFVLLFPRVCIDGEAVNVKIFIFRVIEF